MGTLCSKKPKPRSEAAKAEAAELGPVVLELEGNRLTFEDGAWRSGKRRTGVCNSAVGMALLQSGLPWSLSTVCMLFGGSIVCLIFSLARCKSGLECGSDQRFHPASGPWIADVGQMALL
jgi:hypothetical protein